MLREAKPMLFIFVYLILMVTYPISNPVNYRNTHTRMIKPTEENTTMRPVGYYRERFETLVPLDEPEWMGRRKWCLHRIISNEQRYKDCPRPEGVPWFFIAAIHMMEASGDFSRDIAEGMPIRAGSTWEQKTLHDLLCKGYGTQSITTISEFGAACERWNGYGYAMKDMDSPYLFSGSTYGRDVGKYVADGEYNPNFQSAQIGTMVLLYDWYSHLKRNGMPMHTGTETFTVFPAAWDSIM